MWEHQTGTKLKGAAICMQNIEICGFTIDRDENAARNLEYLSTLLDSKHLTVSIKQGLPEVLREVTMVEIPLAAEPANELWPGPRGLRGLRVMCH